MTTKLPVPQRRQRTVTALAIRTLTACCAALVGLSGCGGSGEDAGDPAKPSSYSNRCQLPHGSSDALHLPAPTGEKCISKARFRLVDENRAEKYTTDAHDWRELSIKVWYPSPSVPGGARADYLEPAIAPSVKAQMAIPTTAPDVQINAKWESPFEPGVVYPVVIFSPGYGMVAENYSTLLEDLASRGLVVVGIDHPYISGTTSRANGELAQAMTGPATTQQRTEFLDEAVTTMVADQRQVMDWLQGPTTGLLRGHLDLARIGLFGHSIGGAAAIQTARSDARAKAGLDIDGAIFGGTAGSWRTPMMFLLSSNHVADETIDAALRIATGPSRKVTVQDAGHLDFSDLKWLLAFYVPELSPQALAMQGFGAIEAPKALESTRLETWSFFRQFMP
jgi:dienelactone hydrolase